MLELDWKYTVIIKIWFAGMAVNQFFKTQRTYFVIENNPSKASVYFEKLVTKVLSGRCLSFESGIQRLLWKLIFWDFSKLQECEVLCTRLTIMVTWQAHELLEWIGTDVV